MSMQTLVSTAVSSESMATSMQGRRLPDGHHSFFDSKPGDYWLEPNGSWYAVTPNGLYGNLTAHDIEIHEDATITVSPSILVHATMGHPEYHGYLERGVWRES